MVARLISAPPERDLLDTVRGLEGDDSELGGAVHTLAAAARATTLEAVSEEHFNLFTGVGRGELLPFASYYLTGFLNEKPLARLRGDMADLGIARADEAKEPEDHIASLCEMMAGQITGAFGAPSDLARQRQFFAVHIGCWAPRFFADLQAAEAAAFATARVQNHLLSARRISAFQIHRSYDEFRGLAFCPVRSPDTTSSRDTVILGVNKCPERRAAS